MPKKSLGTIIWVYSTMILVTIAMLVFWIIYVVHSSSRINELVVRLGGSGEIYHWIILAIGCVLFVVLIVGLSLQMAQSISAISYSRKQDEFVSNITHELKSPLAAIKLHGQTLMQEGVSGEEKNRFLNYILQQSDRMTTLVDNVMEISRLSSKNGLLKIEQINLEEFFQDYFEEMNARVTSHEMTFQGDAKTTATMMGNPLALHRVLDNLFDNAIKASQKGGVIGCHVSKIDHKVEIVVWDEGVGIPKRELKKIFKRFYQIGSEIRGRRKGTGLGLAIVKGLIKEMNGKIKVMSQEEKMGTRFVMRFPILT